MKNLNAGELKIFNDHLKFNCVHLLIKGGKGHCYVIMRKTKKKGLPVAQLHYISDSDIFLEEIGRVNFMICSRLKIFGMLIYEAYFKNRHIKYSFKI